MLVQESNVNSTDLLTVSRKLLFLMDLKVFTEVSVSQSLVSLLTEQLTSAVLTLVKLSFLLTQKMPQWSQCGCLPKS